MTFRLVLLNFGVFRRWNLSGLSAGLGVRWPTADARGSVAVWVGVVQRERGRHVGWSFGTALCRGDGLESLFFCQVGCESRWRRRSFVFNNIPVGVAKFWCFWIRLREPDGPHLAVRDATCGWSSECPIQFYSRGLVSSNRTDGVRRMWTMWLIVGWLVV